MLISTFYSKNLISYTQSAGNLYTNSLKSSSETTRDTSYLNLSVQATSAILGGAYPPSAGLVGKDKEGKENFNFELFNKVNKNNISKDWLTWFIGFSEGDGAILTSKNKARFVLTQKEGAILYHIQEVLGFGIVKQFNGYYRYIVTDTDSILLLLYIFNGNLVLPHRQKQLENWFNTLSHNSDCSSNLNMALPLTKLIKPTLNDAWLSGFTDAEGCFNVNIKPRLNTITGYRVSIRFFLDQKNAESTLLHIKDLFNYGQVNIRKDTNNVYRYSIDSNKGLLPIINYFLTFPLKTKKFNSFKKWLDIYNMVLNKEHLNKEGLEKIRAMSKIINLNNSLNGKTGSSNP